MTKEQLDRVYEALLGHDGNTMCPDWSARERRALTLALDALRLELHLRKENHEDQSE